LGENVGLKWHKTGVWAGVSKSGLPCQKLIKQGKKLRRSSKFGATILALGAKDVKSQKTIPMPIKNIIAAAI
jgi:hypothetical protein